MTAAPGEPIRIANCSGFFGDRISAARDMVEGGPIDVLTGDWLAELTMLILSRTRAKRPGGGYARTFLTQMEQVIGTCLDRGIKVVSNAGGLDPDGCADAVAALADRLGLSPRIAYVTGDDLTGDLDALASDGHEFANLDTGEPLGYRRTQIVTANAYLGCWGIVDALSRGADVVVTGRVTDAAVVCGPAAWHHGWRRHDYDQLAGAIVAGHVIECGGQATGGNYSFFREVPGLDRVGLPWAEIAADGAAVIGKHDGTGGLVSIGTVTSQLLYEIGDHRYLNPDVTSRFDTIRLEQVGADRVRISGTIGEPPPDTLKVAMNYVGGYRNEVTVALTGLEVEAKAEVLSAAFWAAYPFGPADLDDVRIDVVRTDRADADTNEQATALWRVGVQDTDPDKVGRVFSDAVTELVLTTIPGMYTPGSGPGAGSSFGVYWPTTIPAELVPQHVTVLGGDTVVVESTVPAHDAAMLPLPLDPVASLRDWGPTRRLPLGTIVGARSGDKGGNANLGLFARSAEAWEWLDDQLTVTDLKSLLPEIAELRVRRYRFENLWSVNFVIEGLLGRGVASSTRQDRQAKSLGEWLRSRVVDIPEVRSGVAAGGGGDGHESSGRGDPPRVLVPPPQHLAPAAAAEPGLEQHPQQR